MKKLNEIIQNVLDSTSSSIITKSYLDLDDLLSVKLVLFSQKKYSMKDCDVYAVRHENDCVIVMIVTKTDKKNRRTVFENIMSKVSFIEHNYNIIFIKSQTQDCKNYLIMKII